MASQTLLPGNEWVAGRDGIEHQQPRSGRRPAACGAAYLDPRYARPDLKRERCGDCLDKVGITVAGPR